MRRQHEMWPEPDREAIEEQWLDNKLLSELVSHSLLHAETPLERVLTKELARLIDRGNCPSCDEREWKERIEEAQANDGSLEHRVFAPRWPRGLKQGETYTVLCDDKGRTGASWLRVFVAGDNDAHVVMQDWESYPEGSPSTVPSLRCRTYAGGGRHGRVHQALLWLARAIQLDESER